MSKSNGQAKEKGGESPRIDGGESLGLDHVLDAAVDQMPEVTGHGREVIEENRALGDDPSDLDDSELNALGDGGDVFSPDVHEVDDGGNPIKNSDGSFRRKRGRKKGVNYGGTEIVVSDEAKAKAAAVASVDTMIALCRGVFGEEWSPVYDKKLGIDERANLISAFEAYYVQAGVISIPPSLGIVIALGAFALPRTQLENTKGKLAKFSGWVKGWFVRGGSPQ